MIRFKMPDSSIEDKERIHMLMDQFDAFESSQALAELLAKTDADRANLAEKYNRRRKPEGGVLETYYISPMDKLESMREELYPLFRELGFIDINKPLREEYNHVLILGGTLRACWDRVTFARDLVRAGGSETVRCNKSVDALTCFRPVHPVESKKVPQQLTAETEFGALTQAINKSFGIDPGRWTDEFTVDRNLNSISCVRKLQNSDPAEEYLNCSIYAAPSGEPDMRRTDTGDSLEFYIKKNPHPGSLLAISNNRFCNRQFLQMAYTILKTGCRADLDIIGCFADDRLVTQDEYDPTQYMQDLIGILDWINRFRAFAQANST